MFTITVFVLAVGCIDIFEPIERNIPVLDDMVQANRMGGYPLLNFLNIEYEKLKPYFAGISRAWRKLTTSKNERLHLDEYVRFQAEKKNSLSLNLHYSHDINAESDEQSNSDDSSSYCDEEGTESIDGPNCICKSGYVGPRCNVTCEHGYYYQGGCSCYSGYKGTDCSVACKYGTLSEDGTSCECNEGYQGDDCSINCFSIGGSVTTDDDGNSVCTCYDGYYGSNCAYSECFLGEINVCPLQ